MNIQITTQQLEKKNDSMETTNKKIRSQINDIL